VERGHQGTITLQNPQQGTRTAGHAPSPRGRQSAAHKARGLGSIHKDKRSMSMDESLGFTSTAFLEGLFLR